MDAQMKAVLDELAELGPKPIETLTPDEARRQPLPADAVASLMRKRNMTPYQRVASVQHVMVPGWGGLVPARVYVPRRSGPLPVVVYFHGGGWVIATLDSYDASCRALADLAGALVVSVDYRQAPEHRFPAAVYDAYAALQWVRDHAAAIGGDPGRLAVAGEGAGGNLAAVCALLARDRGIALAHQLLIYPVTNHAFDTPSYAEHADASPLDARMMRWFWGHYLVRPQDGQSSMASPLRADLHALPPATVILAEIDPLRDEGAAYAERLAEAGVPVGVHVYQGVTHEFFGMGAVVCEAQRAERAAGRALRDAFGRETREQIAFRAKGKQGEMLAR